jgi:hypothetical protein
MYKKKRRGWDVRNRKYFKETGNLRREWMDVERDEA